MITSFLVASSTLDCLYARISDDLVVAYSLPTMMAKPYSCLLKLTQSTFCAVRWLTSLLFLAVLPERPRLCARFSQSCLESQIPEGIAQVRSLQ